MNAFILMTGIFNVLFGLAVQFASGVAIVLPKDSPGMTTHLFGITAAFLGCVLILSSRDLKRFGVIVAAEGILRVFGFTVMAYYAVFGGYETFTLLLACADGLLGIAYLVLIPRHLNVTLVQLFRDAWQPKEFTAL